MTRPSTRTTWTFMCDLCGARIVVDDLESAKGKIYWFPSGAMGTHHRCLACPPQAGERKLVKLGGCGKCGRIHGESTSWCSSCKEADRRRKTKRVADGLCRSCSSPREDKKKVSCERCRAEETARQASKPPRGVCRQCSQPAVLGLSYCSEHLRYHAQRRRK